MQICCTAADTGLLRLEYALEKFTRTPLDQIRLIDLEQLIGWPETTTIEYKQTIPSNGKQPDKWMEGGEYGNYGRDKIFKEIVAFANAQGGDLILGMGEDGKSSAKAGFIASIPRCIELSERLRRAASSSIDPQIPLLMVRGIETQPDGSGVVVFRVPASRLAPHRAPDKECYVRRQDNSEPMNMREIKEMTLASNIRHQANDEIFERSHQRFKTMLNGPESRNRNRFGFRITGVPVSGPLEMRRMVGQHDLLVRRPSWLVKCDFGDIDAYSGMSPLEERALVRGARRFSENESRFIYFDMYTDGVIETYYAANCSSATSYFISLEQIIGYFINTCLTINNIRSEGLRPDYEYGIEVEFCSFYNDRKAILRFNQSGHDKEVGKPIDLPLRLPRLSLGPVEELNILLSTLLTDISDATGSGRQFPIAVDFDYSQIGAAIKHKRV